MKNIVIDFESYYDKDLSVTTMGVPNYVAKADAYLISVVSDEVEFCGGIEDLPRELGDSWMTDPDLQFWAFNSNFDQKIWEKYYPRTANPWKCGLDRAAFSQLPRHLAGVAKVTLGVDLDKSIRDEMKGVRYESLPEPRQAQVQEYCLGDGVTGKRLLEALPEMSDVEDKVAAHTRLCNRRGVHIDEDKVARDKTWLERLRHEAMMQIPWVQDGLPPLSYPRFAEHCAKLGVLPPKSLDKRDPDCKEWIQDNPEAAKAILAMREFRGTNTKLEKIKTLLENVTEEGILPLELLYCGARHTRRWSSKGFNVQNLDKEPAFVDLMSKWDAADLGGAAPGIFMRNYLIPPPGHVFGIIDFAQIEPRCLNWICGNDEMLTAMRQGFGIYEAYARSVGIWSGNVGMKAGNPKLYHDIKCQVLGLGYGMGADTYSTHSGKPVDEAQVDVKEWRRRNPKTVAQWGYYDGMIRSAAVNHTDLEIEMPTGDVLRHHSVRNRGRGYCSLTIKGDHSQQSVQNSLWGGTLMENVTQRMARDILAEAVLRVEKAGIPVIFHAHDEVIVALPIQGAEDCLKETMRLMSIPPDWCEDLPLGVEGDVSPCYTKL
jgi:DNA polymerase